MAEETVNIGCRLPNGILLEIDVKATASVENGVGGKKLVPRVVKGPRYQQVKLEGWYGPYREALKLDIAVPAPASPQAFINRNVPKAFWEQWKKEHPRSWLLKKGHIFEAATDADAQSKKAELSGETPILAPMSKDQKFTTGRHRVEKLRDEQAQG